jgi:hypothetical protein
MNDIVRVTGFYRQTPTLRFVQKGRGVTSITGEKLYEHQALEAVQSVLLRHRMNPVFTMVLADEGERVYRVHIELSAQTGPRAHDLAQEIDTALGGLNLEYAAKRASGRLNPLALCWLQRGTGDAYRRYCVAAGQREGQFKPVALQRLAGFGFPIDDYRVATP